MPRKPNYKFERHEREKAKAAKRAARAQAKQEKAEQRRGDQPETETAEHPSEGPPSAADDGRDASPHPVDGA